MRDGMQVPSWSCSVWVSPADRPAKLLPSQESRRFCFQPGITTMQLTDVRIDRFGSLKNVSIEKLSHRVTVFWGANGTGKSTFVRFVRGLMYGFCQNSSWSHSDFDSESGCARVQTASGARTLRRTWSANSNEQFTMTDDCDRSTLSGQNNLLPAWVTEDVFREIFTVGHVEAERFDLLTRLCVESGMGRNDHDAELRQAEAGLIQTARDRDGEP